LAQIARALSNSGQVDHNKVLVAEAVYNMDNAARWLDYYYPRRNDPRIAPMYQAYLRLFDQWQRIAHRDAEAMQNLRMAMEANRGRFVRPTSIPTAERQRGYIPPTEGRDRVAMMTGIPSTAE